MCVGIGKDTDIFVKTVDIIDLSKDYLTGEDRNKIKEILSSFVNNTQDIHDRVVKVIKRRQEIIVEDVRREKYMKKVDELTKRDDEKMDIMTAGFILIGFVGYLLCMSIF